MTTSIGRGDASRWRRDMVAEGLAGRVLVVMATIALLVGCTAGPGAPPSQFAAPMPSVSRETAAPSAARETAGPHLATWVLSFDQTQLDAGRLIVGTEDDAVLALRNEGQYPITAMSLAIEPPGDSGLSIVAVEPRSCAAGKLGVRSECQVTIRFRPLGGAAERRTLRATGVRADGTSVQAEAILIGSSWLVRSVVPEETAIDPADLAVTVAGDSEFVHVAVRLEEAWGVDLGADAIVYLRTGDEGRSWGQRLMFGGGEPRLAAAGRQVYIAFQAYGCHGIGVRRNREHGRRRAWSGPTCLARTADLAGSPDIAAADRFVYVASVGAARGRVAVHVSRDRGRTWRRVPLGFSRDEAGEADGSIAVAATGRLAAVAWTDRNVSYVRISEDGGRRWSSPVRLSDGRVTSAAARDGRLAVSGIGHDGVRWVWVRTEDGTWRSITLPSTRDGPPEVPCYGESWVVLGPAGGVAVPYADCRWDGLGYDARSLWATSTDDGAKWGTPDPFPGEVDEETVPIAWAMDGRVYLLFYGEEEYLLAVRDEGR